MHVYVIGPIDGPYKVGMTADLARRLRALQLRSEAELFLHHVSAVESRPHARLVESAAHDQLRASSLSGEWFSCSIEDAQKAIRKALDGIVAPPHEPAAPAPFSAKAFGDFLDHMNWSKRRCARELGVAYNSVDKWLREGAPGHIGLACSTLARGWPAWTAKLS